MTDIPFPASSSPGVRPQEGGGRLVNAYAEKAPPGASSKLVWRRAPGLRQLAETVSHSHTRGFLDCGATLIPIFDQRAYALTVSGVVYTLTNLGALTGTLPVTTARNNNATPQNVAVTENGAFNLFTGSAPTAFADVDLPIPNSVSVLHGYLMFTIGDGRIFATNLNSVSVAANSFTTEQGLLLRRGVTYGGLFYAMGDKWTGVYRDAALSPFPLERTVTIARGIVGTNAVAGWETGWQNILAWVADDFTVVQLDGQNSYNTVVISTDDVSRDIEAAVKAGNGALLEAHVYANGQNAMWALTYPDNWTWERNMTTGEWNERESYGEEDWRGRQSVKWQNRWIVGDKATGKLGEAAADYLREYSDPLIWEVESGIVASFPGRIAIPRADFALTAGVGSPSSVPDPQVQISISLDGGANYGNPILRNLGAEGDTGSHPYIARCGLTRGQGARFRLRVSDPVHVCLAGEQIATEQRAE